MKRLMYLIPFVSLLFTADVEANLDGAVDVHGFVSTGYLNSSHNNFIVPTKKGTAEFFEGGVSFNRSVNDRLRIGIQIASRKFGRFGDSQVGVDWALADYSFSDKIGIRAGKVKLPLGLYNHTIDTDASRQFIFLPQGIYPETFKNNTIAILGTLAYGMFETDSYGDFNYQAYIGVADIGASDQYAKDIFDSIDKDFVTHMKTTAMSSQFALGYHVSWSTPVDGLQLVATAFHSNFDYSSKFEIFGGALSSGSFEADSTYTLFIHSLEYVRNQLTASIEHSTGRWKGYEAVIGVISVPYRYWFHSLTTRLDWEIRDNLTVAAYYNNFKYGKAQEDFFKDLAISIRYEVKENWMLKGELHRMDGPVPNDLFPPSDPSLHNYLFAAKLTYSF